MKIQTYEDMELLVIDKTPILAEVIQFACDLTMKKADDISGKKASNKLVKALLDAEHTSIFEHGSITFLARGISRSLLAQVTRQRTFSFTSASQHYQDYRDYPMSLREGWKNGDLGPDIEHLYSDTLFLSLQSYIRLIELGEKPEEARQVLPNACTVNLLITANPRAIALFLRQRLCWRNTMEMQAFAHKLSNICAKWFPELFEHIAEPCTMDGECNQGRLACSRKL